VYEAQWNRKLTVYIDMIHSEIATRLLKQHSFKKRTRDAHYYQIANEIEGRKSHETVSLLGLYRNSLD